MFLIFSDSSIMLLKPYITPEPDMYPDYVAKSIDFNVSHFHDFFQHAMMRDQIKISQTSKNY